MVKDGLVNVTLGEEAVSEGDSGKEPVRFSENGSVPGTLQKASVASRRSI
jgi:hypothetical protein